MKRKNFRLRLASLVVFLLVGVMGVTAAVSSFLGGTASGSVISTNSAIQATQSDKNISSLLNQDAIVSKSNKIKDSDRVGLIVEMNETSLIDIYNANPNGYESFEDYRLSTEGKNAAENLKNKQMALFNKIARQANVTLKYNYVNALNGFAIEITYGERNLIESIAKKANVFNTQISERYLAPETTVIENTVGALDTGIFDSTAAREEGLAGQGTIVAVLDTGLDWEHVAFDPNNKLFDLENQKRNGTLKLSKEDVEAVIPELSASTTTNQLNISDLYRNEKVPFGYDYSDYDPEISSHVANSHGTHVAGIVAGHSEDPYMDKNNNGEFDRDATGEDDEHYYDEKGEVITGIVGVAPQAQLGIFKVFPDGDGGAESYAMLAAIEDCIILGVDVINMSLGGDCGFQDETNSKDSIFSVYHTLESVGISLVVAAGNSYSASFGSHYGLNLISNPDSGLLSTPGSYDASFTVASISGKKSPYMLAVDKSGNENGTAYFLDSTNMAGEPYDFLEEIYAKVEELGLTQYVQEDGSLKVPYVTIAGVGSSSNYAGKNVKNKIALVSRGEINFEDKVIEAYLHGAIACIVYNNASGVIRMQVGDNPTIPSCSITMDAASTIKNKDAYGEVYFIIDPNAEAGPFISEFSSWGPLPNLILKPDITAHGGEIYSAIPGDETAYSRLSGTSMACPNTAGVVALLRQYFKRGDVAAKFGIDLNNDGKVAGFDELNVMERRIYQILQSTATIANDEQGNPYSPRKQGAGLADLDTSRTTEQYLYVLDEDGNEKERTKLELFDDPNRTGVYELEFYAKNVGATAANYKIDAFVMTEGISSNGKTVNEKAHILSDNTRELKIDGAAADANGVITIGAGDSVKINYTVTLGAQDRAWLEQFKNGMYVEGYVCLTSADEDGVDLNLPYLAFYGDWSEAPMLDYDMYETSKDEHDDTIDDDDKRYANTRALMLIGKIVENNTEYSLPLGMFPFNIPEEFEAIAPDSTEDYCAITYDSDTGMYGLFCVAGFLRSAKKLFWQITDATTGDVIMENVYHDARKAVSSGSSGGAWIELDLGVNLDLVNNRKYNMAIYPVLDWNAEDFNSIQDVINYNEAYNATHPNNTRRYCWDSDFWVDTDAPYISDAEVRIERDKKDNASYYLDLYLTDNHYISSMGFDYYDKDEKDFVSAFSEDGMRPVNCVRNSTTLVTYDLTNLWDQISEGILYRKTQSANAISQNPELGTYLTQFEVQLFDYAFNTSFYTIDLYDLMNNLSSVSFGEIGNYAEYTNPDDRTDKVKVLSSYDDTVKTDINGNQLALREMTIVPGQKVELMKAVIANPSTAWREDFIFSVSGVGEDVLKIDEETGEIYALPGLTSEVPVTATVTIKSRANSAISASITVRILTVDEVAKYNINTNRLEAAKSIESLSFEDVNGRYFRAGESYLVEVEANPWYIELDPEKYFISWSSSNNRIATVSGVESNSGEVALGAYITANDGYYNEAGEYVKNNASYASITAQLCQYNPNGAYTDANGNKYNTTFYSATYTVIVLQEFVVEGSELKEYNGTPDNGKVIIPDNLGIKTIKDNLFYKRDDITEIIFNEGLETIGYAACAYMPNLERVELPSTITKIGSYGFAAYNPINAEGPDTKLSIVDTTKCAKPIQVGQLAFALQRYINVDMTRSTIRDYGEDTNKRNIIVLQEENVFVTTMFRVVEMYAMYGLHFVNDLDLTNVRMAGEAAFYEIGYGLPKYNLPLANVTFNEHTAMGTAALASAGIGEITLPMSRIGMQTFYGITTSDMAGNVIQQPWEVLRKITFTADNLVIDEGAFLYCGVEEIVFKGNVDYIGEGAFAYANVKTITYDQGVTVREIAAQAFYGTPLTQFELPAGLEVLGNGVFGQCSNLTKIIVDKDCRLTDLGIDNTVDSVGSSPFYECPALNEFEVESGNVNFKSVDGIIYSADGTKLVNVPCAKRISDANALLSGVTALGNFAFACNTSITSVDLSNVVSMGIGVFYECSNLTSVTLSDNLLEIPTEAFYNCTRLSTVNISSNSRLEKVGLYSFFSTAIRSINLPETVYEIGEGTFGYCASLTSFTLPRLVTEIRSDTFYEATALRTIELHRWLTKVGDRAFAYSGLTSISNASALTTVGEAAFASCPSLATVNLPALKTIGDYAFMADIQQDTAGNMTINAPLTRVTITNVEHIGDYAFYCQQNVTSFGSLNKCTYIGDVAFYGCTSVQSISATAVEYIGENAFTDSGIMAFNSSSQYMAALPATVEFVHGTAFASTYIMAFSAESGSDYFTSDGVLYRNTAGGYELVCFPSYKQNSMEYVILDGTVRIGAYAFSFTQYVNKVDIPASVKMIGDCAFYASSVNIFNFKTLEAPILEASYQSLDTGNDVYFWQIYNNFYMPFSFSYEMYGGYKYNPIRLKTEEDILTEMSDGSTLQNTAYTAEDLEAGIQGYWYGIMICYPSNAKGFDNFIWSHYFDTVLSMPELIENDTLEVIELIKALPEESKITEANRSAIQRARSRFNALSSDQQRAFVRAEGLVEVLEKAEAKLVAISENAMAACDNVVKLITELPSVSALTLDHKSAVVAARAAYNALSADNKAVLDQNALAMNKLAECEARIAQLESGDSDSDKDSKGCGTVAFGTSGGGTGLMIGLIATMLACLAVVFFSKKKAAQR